MRIILRLQQVFRFDSPRSIHPKKPKKNLIKATAKAVKEKRAAAKKKKEAAAKGVVATKGDSATEPVEQPSIHPSPDGVSASIK